MNAISAGLILSAFLVLLIPAAALGCYRRWERRMLRARLAALAEQGMR